MQLRNNLSFYFKKFLQTALFVSACLLVGISSGDQIELQTYFNARYSANFKKSSNNVSNVLAPQTKAKVTEVKQMPSGNLGLRVNVLTGKSKGKTVWVYYNKQTPRMKLYGSIDASGQEVSSKETEKIGSVKAQKNIQALNEPDLESDDSQEELKSTVKSLNQVQRDVQKVGKKSEHCENCEWSDAGQEGGALDSSVSASRGIVVSAVQTASNASVIKPINLLNTKIGSPVCRTSNGYDSCTYRGDRAPTVFKVFNTGPNRVVAGKATDKRREWSFYSPNSATQDLGFYIEDYNGSNFSNSQRSYVMLFPRKSLSSVRVSGEEKIVTLPTGETVTFNQRTNEVIAGAFAETARLGSSNSAPIVKYQGNGVMVRADAAGVNEPKQARTATISKNGQTCKVPSSELWKQGNNSELNFKFPSDSDFNKYLSSRCGFGI